MMRPFVMLRTPRPRCGPLRALVRHLSLSRHIRFDAHNSPRGKLEGMIFAFSEFLGSRDKNVGDQLQIAVDVLGADDLIGARDRTPSGS